MNKAIKSAVCALMWMFVYVVSLEARSYEPIPFSRLNSNASFTVSVPLSNMTSYSTPAWGFVYGAGYNISKRHSVLGEVMWNRLLPTNEALMPIRAALQINDINGHGNLIALTANYRLQIEGKVFGTYLIAGGGMYYRGTGLSQIVAVGDSVSCTPAWLLWGFTCESGIAVSLCDEQRRGYNNHADHCRSFGVET
jgi:hypothetical protein